jgi:cation/acetate symporter
MLCGIAATGAYIIYFKFLGGSVDDWLWGISPEGIGTIGMLLNFAVAIPVALLTSPPPVHVQQLVEDIRLPATDDED